MKKRLLVARIDNIAVLQISGSVLTVTNKSMDASKTKKSNKPGKEIDTTNRSVVTAKGSQSIAVKFYSKSKGDDKKLKEILVDKMKCTFIDKYKGPFFVHVGKTDIINADSMFNLTEYSCNFNVQSPAIKHGKDPKASLLERIREATAKLRETLRKGSDAIYKSGKKLDEITDTLENVATQLILGVSNLKSSAKGFVYRAKRLLGTAERIKNSLNTLKDTPDELLDVLLSLTEVFATNNRFVETKTKKPYEKKDSLNDLYVIDLSDPKIKKRTLTEEEIEAGKIKDLGWGEDTFRDLTEEEIKSGKITLVEFKKTPDKEAEEKIAKEAYKIKDLNGNEIKISYDKWLKNRISLISEDEQKQIKFDAVWENVKNMTLYIANLRLFLSDNLETIDDLNRVYEELKKLVGLIDITNEERTIIEGDLLLFYNNSDLVSTYNKKVKESGASLQDIVFKEYPDKELAEKRLEEISKLNGFKSNFDIEGYVRLNL